MRDRQVLPERYDLVAARLRGDGVLLLLVFDANDEADEVFLRTGRGLASTHTRLSLTPMTRQTRYFCAQAEV
jgi:hypothetical protein